MSEYEDKKSEAYHRGKIKGVKQVLYYKCEKCGYGYEPKLKDKKWMHEDVECDGQREWNLIKIFEKDENKAYLDKRYGTMWHTSYKKENRLLDEACYCCNEKAVRRIDVNCWGVVGEFDVCKEHAKKYDGICCDEVLKEKDKCLNII